jgi:putative holliday junction resolvase
LRHLCLDLGSKRIGVAISDETGLISRPVGVINVVSRQQALQAVLRYLQQEEAGAIVVGLPLRLNGEEGIESGRAREFARQLSKLTELPIDFMDERLSSVEAERLMQEVGVKRNKRRAQIDARAAAIILQTYLDARRNQGLA